MDIAIIGADGQLGTDLVLALSEFNVTPLYYPDFDILRSSEAESALRDINPDIVINTAAFNRVDDGEDVPTEAFQLNTLAVKDLAASCRTHDFVLVHFSTDYVFDGTKNSPYSEEDLPNPLNVYGISKLAGEYIVQCLMDRFFLIRTSSLYGAAGCLGMGKKNFIDSMLALEKEGKSLRVVDDQYVTPTSTSDLADHVAELIRTEHYGLYHMTNSGSCSWYEYAQSIFDILGIRPDLLPTDSASFGARALRPVYSVLENRQAECIGLSDFPDWKDSLKDYLEKKGYLA
ncbi:dTDP-4-dehydrorhamnose reductase [Acidobacteriota bacterium]